MHVIAREAMALLPPPCRLRPQDVGAIEDHAEYLLGLGPLLVQGFYDTLYAHPPTAEILGPQERATREETLTAWWRRSVEGPLDEDYFAWMAMVGLVHVVRNVANPAMLAMTGFVVETISGCVRDSGLPPGEADAVAEAVRRLCSTVAAIITFGYDQAVVSALYTVAGMPEALLRRLRDQEVDAALTHARLSLQR